MKEIPDQDSSACENMDLLGIVQALLDTLDDKDQDVRQMVSTSIARISAKHSDAVIRTTVYFWETHKKISTVHKASVLRVMSNVSSQFNSLNADLASSIAEVAVNELMGELEKEAAELLMALSREHCVQAMGGLLNKLEPGVLPHHIIVYTMGKLAIANPHGMLSFIKLAMTIILPMLQQMREENLKQAVCFMIGKFCEAISDYIMNAENKSPEVNKEKYKEEICSIFDFFTHNWLKTSRDVKSIEAILTALVSMIPLLPQELDSERIIKLVPVCLNLCKKQDVRGAAVRVLAVVLHCATVDDKEALRTQMEQLHQTLFGFVSILPFNEARDDLLTHYEVLKCSKSMVILYPEEALDRILQHLKSSNVNQRTRALVVLKYLINALPQEDDGWLHKIAHSLQESLGENSALQMVGAIAALLAKPAFSLSPSQRAAFVRYMVSHCETKSNDKEAYVEALHLLATTVDGAESWLWPCLIEILLDSAYTASVTSVLRALSSLATKMVNYENLSTSERDFPGTKVLGRCLELLSDPANRLAVVTFLQEAAPLMGHQINDYWNESLEEFINFLKKENNWEFTPTSSNQITWEERVEKWLEESVKLEGKSWGAKLADELALKSSTPNVAPLLALVCDSNTHIILLIELARSHGANREFTRAVGICAKRHLKIVLKEMQEFCAVEDERREPVKILGFMKDFVKDFSKTVAASEMAKAGLLQSYAEIAQRATPSEFFPTFEKHVIPWTIKQLTSSKEFSVRKAGLSVLEQVGETVHRTKDLWLFEGLPMKGRILAVLMGMLQSPSGYKPLPLYPAILRAINSISRVPPALNSEESEILLGGVLDKTIGATTEIILLVQSETVQQDELSISGVVRELGTLANEITSTSTDALAALIDILLPWIQSKSEIEKKTALLVLKIVLVYYHDSIKYTYPSGKFDVGKLVGRSLSWCGIAPSSLRPLAVDCVCLALQIACRHRSITSDNISPENLKNIQTAIADDDSSIFFKTVKSLAENVSERIPSGEIIGLAEGLIESLLFSREVGLVASIALSQHFKIKGSEMSRNDVDLVNSIITQMRHMENASCRNSAAEAVVLLMAHHPEEVTERLLYQPLPLDRSTELCWQKIGDNDFGHRALELLLIKLEASNPFAEIATSAHSEKSNVASFPSLTAVIALRHLLQSSNAESLIDKQLPRLLSILLKYLAGWLHVNAPTTLVNTKYGYVPNREASKINPHMEVYSVLTNVLTIVEPSVASSLLNETVFLSKTKAEDSVISTVRTLIRCVLVRNDVLLNMAQSVGKLLSSAIAIQRAVAAAFYAELIGNMDCGVIWLDAIINNLHEAKTDSSSLVRTLATVGLSRVAYLDQKLIDVYLDNCIDALLDGLEEPANGEGGGEVVIESLRGLSRLLLVQYKTPVSPRVVMALKPFIEKEDPNIKLAALTVLNAIVYNWQRTAPSADDDLIDHFLWCLPCLIIRLEDTDKMVVETARETLCKAADILPSKRLSDMIHSKLELQSEFHFETFMETLITYLKCEYPQRVEELRNAVSRGYSRSENYHTRATSAKLLGMLGSSRPEDIQRLLQLLRDRESTVRIRASEALALLCA